MICAGILQLNRVGSAHARLVLCHARRQDVRQIWHGLKRLGCRRGSTAHLCRTPVDMMCSRKRASLSYFIFH